MGYKNLLVLSDFSSAADQALNTAVEFAEKFGSKLTVLHVLPDETNLSFVLSGSEYHRLEKKLASHAEEMFASLEERIPGLCKVEYRTKIRKGIPYINCLEEIESGGYDLVFAGSRGRSDLKHIFVGSTAEKVLRRSPISVFVTRGHDRQ